MVEIQISLPEPLNAFVETQIAAGHYTSINEYLHVLIQADQVQARIVERLHENPQLAEHLQRGLESGEGRRWSPSVLSELKQQVVDRASGNKG